CGGLLRSRRGDGKRTRGRDRALGQYFRQARTSLYAEIDARDAKDRRLLARSTAGGRGGFAAVAARGHLRFRKREGRGRRKRFRQTAPSGRKAGEGISAP